jgi:hypothetical protein
MTTAKLEAALAMLETHFPGYGIVLTIFDGNNGETIGNRNDKITSIIIEGLYKNRVQVPTSKDTLQ